MKLVPNPFTEALRSGKKQIGLWVSLSSNFAADVVAPSGYDWALLDMEHSPGELSTVLGQLQVFAASGTSAIVRPIGMTRSKSNACLTLARRAFCFRWCSLSKKLNRRSRQPAIHHAGSEA